jgi:CheY-like chemotaxis protein
MPGAPVLLVVDDDLQARGVVEGELRKRYGADYQVICVGSADDPPGLLARLRDGQRLVSIVLAGQRMPAMTGTQLLARVREFHSTARRLLLIEGGYGPPPEPILQAIALGHIDAYAGRPATVPDEKFHLAVTELLEEWARSNLPRPEVTGTDLRAGGYRPGNWPLQRPPMLLESSLPGVFTAGDVRCGSVKRVASAVGEGSVAIRLIHDYLRGNHD